MWAGGIVAGLAVLSTTAADRADARRRLARWNWLFLTFIAIVLFSWLVPWWRLLG